MFTRTAVSRVVRPADATVNRPVRVVSLALWTLLLIWLLIDVVPGYAQVTYVPYLSPGYRYLVVPSGGGPAGFEQPSFDDSGWSIGNAAFGLFGCGTLYGCPLDPTAQTCWPPSPEILLRKTFVLPPTATNVNVGVAIDNDIQVFINGIDISGGLQQSELCATRDQFIFSVPTSILVLGGMNVLAVRARDRGGDSYVDVEVRSGNPPPAPLTGEQLQGGIDQATLNCVPQGTSSLQFNTSGMAFGPYTGTFTESGQLTIDTANTSLVTFNSTFTIISGNRTVTGTKHLSSSGGFGECNPGGFSEALGTLEYNATIQTPTTTVSDSGVSSVFLFWFTDPTTNQSFGFFNEGFTSVTLGPAAMTLDPPNDVNPVGTSHTVTTTVVNGLGNPVSNATVRFMVEGSVSAAGSCTTDANGQCPFTYPGPAFPGADAITAFADSNNNGSQDAGEPQASASKEWIFPTPTPGLVTGGGQTFNSDSTGLIAFGFNARDENGVLSGECTVVDQTTTPRTFIKCTSVTSIVVVPSPTGGGTAEIFGTGTINGAPMTYRIDVTDAAEPGELRDKFAILTSTVYEAGGLLVHGNVQVHR